MQDAHARPVRRGPDISIESESTRESSPRPRTDEVRAREERLKEEVRELRIEIDEARQTRKVAEITGTDHFKDLRARAGELRRSVGG